MIRFNCDYNEGAHPRILKRLIETNMEQTAGYGEDIYCERARNLIQEICNAPNAEVHFLVGGTQTNLTVISAALRSHQCAVAAESGHICVHETGAIEACGHKVISVKSDDGKLNANDIRKLHQLHWEDESREHTTQPKLVYISNPTEVGTIYNKRELEALRKVCDECQMYLFLDGARLGYGLCARDNDLDLPIIAKLCDVFYIGGTKIGALFGEAVVITNDRLKEDFRYIIKQKGGMLAKGRLLGLQFEEMFKDGLYFDMSTHANELAMKLKMGLQDAGYEFAVDSSTNQQFVIVADEALKKLKKNYSFSTIESLDDLHTIVRFCTSWATKEADVDQLLEDMMS
ncbi:threonine aldolase family protein [Lachnospiraceae bacterium LCP25S3_G4]